MRVAIRVVLEMTIGRFKDAGSTYMRPYLSKMSFKADQVFVPQRGAAALAHALADACRGLIRVSALARNIVISDGLATSDVLAEGPIEADAVICAISAANLPDLIPPLGTCARGRHPRGARRGDVFEWVPGRHESLPCS